MLGADVQEQWPCTGKERNKWWNGENVRVVLEDEHWPYVEQFVSEHLISYAGVQTSANDMPVQLSSFVPHQLFSNSKAFREHAIIIKFDWLKAKEGL